MASGIKVKLNSRGMGALLNSSDVRSALTDRAERVLSAAKASAPVASGEYRDSLHIVQVTTDRAVVRVASSAPHAFVVEANTGCLARSLDAGR